MSGIENSNQGPGWSDHNTPYGTIHSYGGTSNNFSASGNGGGNHTGVTEHTTINIASTPNYDGLMMGMCVNNLKVHEGFITHLYKDSLGYITVGIGHLLATAEMAAALPFTRTQTFHGHGDEMEREITMSHDEIVSVYNNYKNSSGVPPEGMHLSNNNVVTQCINDVQTTITGLKGLYSGFDGFSNSRKVALVDMGFNIGIPKLKTHFPNFNAAVNSGDWGKAAIESHRTGLDDSRNPRNKDTHDQLLSDH